KVYQFSTEQHYLACLVTMNLEHNFVLLQIEADANGRPLANPSLTVTPPDYDRNAYLTVSQETNVLTFTGDDTLFFEKSQVIGTPAEGRTIKQRHYLTAFQTVQDEQQGSPVFDSRGL